MKKVLLMAVLGVFMLGLVACGNNGDKQTQTMGDMKSIATGIEMYRTNVGALPTCSGTAEEVYASVTALAIIFGDQKVTKDGWGNDFMISSSAKDDTYFIGSAGNDGKFKGWKQSGTYVSNDYDQDMIYSNGTYVYVPK